MFGIEKLEKAYQDTLNVINFGGGFDTFSLRLGFEHEFSLDKADKDEILDYLKGRVSQDSLIYQMVKKQINDQEFLTTDYYVNPFPRRFRGVYAPVIYKTIGGVLAMSL